MMSRSSLALAFALPLALAGGLAGCVSEVGPSVAPLMCASSTDCPAGLECEVEHMSPTCQPHEGGADPGTTSRGGACASDVDCGAGLECEVEHGVISCQPHRGEDGAPTGEMTCLSDADCGAGLECEVEHGASWCQPHGTRELDEIEDSGGSDAGVGDGGAGEMACLSDADCPLGEECEIEGGASWCQPHSSGD